jgi:hypothetical protein
MSKDSKEEENQLIMRMTEDRVDDDDFQVIDEK